MRLALVVLVACSSHKDEQPKPAPPASADKQATCGAVTARWRETPDDAGYELSFELPGHEAPLPFAHGELFQPDWRFEIFSPDCKHVLLLYSHQGPYHVVRTDRLAAYLAGAKPDHELSGERDPTGKTGTGVFRDGAWLSNTTVAYTWGCCDPPITTKFTLPER